MAPLANTPRYVLPLQLPRNIAGIYPAWHVTHRWLKLWTNRGRYWACRTVREWGCWGADNCVSVPPPTITTHKGRPSVRPDYPFPPILRLFLSRAGRGWCRCRRKEEWAAPTAAFGNCAEWARLCPLALPRAIRYHPRRRSRISLSLWS